MPTAFPLPTQDFFRIFEQIAAIPHGSGNEGAISTYCMDFAAAHGIRAIREPCGNVLLFKPATSGYEEHPAVILQGHLDMVCEKNTGVDFDFRTDPLRLRTDGEWLWAQGTTLGGDDGIAVAYILALMADATLAHPALEAVLTVDEEVGLLGACALDVAPLQGRILLNLDSEEEGIFLAGCAGGSRVRLRRALSAVPFAGQALRVEVQGLCGGHSGTEIDQGHSNAAVLLGKLLSTLSAAAPFRLVQLQGGTKDNAIMRGATATLAVEDAHFAPLLQAGKALAAQVAAQVKDAEPGITVTVTPEGTAATAATEEESAAWVGLLGDLPYGVVAMSAALPGLVQTSLNPGILVTEDGTVTVGFSVRSSVNDERLALERDLLALGEKWGIPGTVDSQYPAWEYRKDSPLRDTMCRVYRDMFGREATVTVIHAGLECGLLSEKLPGLDAVSMGPEMQDIHTPRERLSIPSALRCYDYIRTLLAAL